LQELTDGLAVAITRAHMRVFYLGPLLCAGLLGATTPKVQSISLTGAQNYHLSQELLQRIQGLIGADLRQPAVDELVREIRNELGEYAVSQKVIPGDQPEHVKVVLQVVPASDAVPEPAPEATLEPGPVDVNVNSRYVVEGIDIRGAEERKLSDDLAEEIQQRIGQRFSQDAIDDLARRIRKELRARTVASKVVRGTQPERVRVVFEVGLQREQESGYHLTKFVYHSKQAWSGKAYGDIDLGDNAALLVGIASDADDLLERYAGIGAGFEARKIGSDRVRLGFLFESYHMQWNPATLESGGDIYRTRKSFQPALTVFLARPLKLTVGAAFHQIQMQYPTVKNLAANAATAALRYQQRFRGAGKEKQEVRASYEVRAAARTLDSDFVYARHQWAAAYKIGGPNQEVVASFSGGRLSGQAPLFERYSLGNSTTLRGWNKFDIAPLGGDRAAHNTLEYRHRIDGGTQLLAFYDVGAVWNHGGPAEARHAVGFGLRAWRFQTALAFPVRSGRMEPMFMAGVYFTEGADF
jgi:hypothetical protein